MFITEGVAVRDHSLFLLLEDICGTEGGVGEGKADGRARASAGTNGGLLARRLRCLDDLRLDGDLLQVEVRATLRAVW